MHRIRRTALPTTGRADVPASLEKSLQRSMAKSPDARQQSSLELIREYQAIETELGQVQTPLESAVSTWAATLVAGAEGPGGSTVTASAARLESRPRAASRPTDARELRPGLRRVILLGSLALGVATVTGAGLLITGALSPMADGGILRVGEILTIAGAGSVRFDWKDPGLAAGDTYTVTTGDGAVSVQRGIGFTAAAGRTAPVCITVAVTRAGRAGPRQCREVCERILMILKR